MKPRFLVVGAGALGGYFGGRLLEAGRDVTFLLRPRRKARLDADGLFIHSAAGDVHIAAPPSVSAAELARGDHAPFDVVVVGCKAYDLDQTIESFAPAVGPDTVVLPLLNGLSHLDTLAERFGRDRVLGGLCLISAALDEAGHVHHLSPMHGLTFGELDVDNGMRSARIEAIESAFDGAKFDGIVSDSILLAMWEKWVFIASLAGITTLMRGSVGDIVASGAQALSLALFEECSGIAAFNGLAPRADALERGRAMLTTAGSLLTASMLKDVERGAPTEADHILGDLIARADPEGPGSDSGNLLRTAYAHLKVYEARREREKT